RQDVSWPLVGVATFEALGSKLAPRTGPAPVWQHRSVHGLEIGHRVRNRRRSCLMPPRPGHPSTEATQLLGLIWLPDRRVFYGFFCAFSFSAGARWLGRGVSDDLVFRSRSVSSCLKSSRRCSRSRSESFLIASTFFQPFATAPRSSSTARAA